MISILQSYKKFKKILLSENIYNYKNEIFDDIIRLIFKKNTDSQVSIVKSCVENAGLGLKSITQIRKNSFVCLYSGLYYPPPPLHSISTLDGSSYVIKEQEILNNNIFSQQNNRNIDNYGQQKFSESYKIHLENVGGYIDAFPHKIKFKYENPALSGYLANHPPKGKSSNIVPFDFLWDDLIEYTKTFDESQLGSLFDNINVDELFDPSIVGKSISSSQIIYTLDKFRPTKDNLNSLTSKVLTNFISQVNPIGQGIWYIDPNSYESVEYSPHCAKLAGLALISKKDILDGEELYLNYNYDVKDIRNIPSWYHPEDG